MHHPNQDATPASTDHGGQLIRRAPTGYLWNQAGALWLFVSLLLFEVVVRRSLPAADTNVFDFVSTVANLGFYLASLGLASAGIVYLPRALAEGGPNHARRLALRLVLTRIGTTLLVGALIYWGLPALASAAAASGWQPASAVATSFGATAAVSHRLVIALYVVTLGISTILSSLLVALVRTRIVFLVGGTAQLALLGMTYLFLHTWRGGVDGAILAQSLPMALSAVVFAFALTWALRAPPSPPTGQPFFGKALRLGVASWLADLPQASLVQPVALGQLSAVAPSQLLFFKSTYQMGDAGARFFTEGLGGVSMATMSASYAGNRIESLATGWRTVNKLQVLLALPLVALCVPYAGTIMALLFGPLYASTGSLLAFFLVANGLLQLLGGATHEWTLYVLGGQRWVVLSRWVTLAVLALTGALLVPRFYALGALLAVSLGRLVAQVFLLVVAWVLVRRPYPILFAAKLLLTLTPPTLAVTLWQPMTLAHDLVTSLAWLPASVRLPAEQIIVLGIAGLLFLALFLICLRLVRPLDAEDVALLTQVPSWLRAALLPFAARRYHKPTAATKPMSALVEDR
ncbi:MAG TPA: hypothetical protein VF807_15360 [Ktedonobacterales bacterium]